MQGIYNYIPERNRIARVYSVAAVLYLQFVLHVTIFPKLNVVYFRHISTYRNTRTVLNMAVVCSSLMSCFPGMKFRYFLNDFQMVPCVPTITEVTFVFTLYMSCNSIVSSLYFKIFWASLLT